MNECSLICKYDSCYYFDGHFFLSKLRFAFCSSVICRKKCFYDGHVEKSLLNRQIAYCFDDTARVDIFRCTFSMILLFFYHSISFHLKKVTIFCIYNRAWAVNVIFFSWTIEIGQDEWKMKLKCQFLPSRDISWIRWRIAHVIIILNAEIWSLICIHFPFFIHWHLHFVSFRSTPSVIAVLIVIQ